MKVDDSATIALVGDKDTRPEALMTRIRFNRTLKVVVVVAVVVFGWWLLGHFSSSCDTDDYYDNWVSTATDAKTPGEGSPPQTQHTHPSGNGSVQVVFKGRRLEYRTPPQPEGVCRDKELLVVVPTRPDAFAVRRAIRASWLKEVPGSVLARFIVGFSPDAKVRGQLEQEQSEFGDLILNDILDSYQNLSLKTFAALHWQQTYCPEARYLLKTDDDTVVDLARLLYWISVEFDPVNDANKGKVIFGRTWTNVKARRDPKDKWYTPKEAWPKTYFPKYCNGPSYLLTSQAVNAILEQTPKVALISLEDVLYTGILADRGHVRRENRDRIFERDLHFRNGCDKFGIPYISAVYEIKLPPNATVDDKHSNVFADTAKALKGYKCISERSAQF